MVPENSCTQITRSPVEILLTHLKKRRKRSRVVSKSKSKNPHVPYAYGIPDSDIIGFIGSSGHSSSVMLLQKNHSITTAQRVNAVSKRAPSILPDVASQRCTLMTKLKIWPIAKRSAAATSRSVFLEGG